MDALRSVLLDCNIYDKLAGDETTRDLLRNRIESGSIRVIATPVVLDELAMSPFHGLPAWFRVDVVNEGVPVYGEAKYGQAEFSDGAMYEAHRGESSGNVRDAILAESAHKKADILVSDDSRCRNRLSMLSRKCVGMTYEEFARWLQEALEWARSESAASSTRSATTATASASRKARSSIRRPRRRSLTA